VIVPIMVELDSDVAAMLLREAEGANLSFDVLGNRILRMMLEGVSADAADAVEGPPSEIALHEDWFVCTVARGVNEGRPGIYEWKIDGRVCYVCYFTNIGTATKAYSNNLRNLLGGKPYRAGKPGDFRQIHYQLRDAYLGGRKIEVAILENCATEHLSQRRMEIQRERGLRERSIGGANSGIGVCEWLMGGEPDLQVREIGGTRPRLGAVGIGVR